MGRTMRDPVDPRTLDRFTELAARVLDVPVVHLDLMDETRGMVVSSVGVRESTAMRERPLAAVVEIALVASDDRPVGTLTVMDWMPRRWSAPQREFLKELTIRIVGEVDIGPIARRM